MDLINKLLSNIKYINKLNELAECEIDREYCKHDIEHFLSEARIGYIYNLENNCGYTKDVIYLTALLHDIGKADEYKYGLPHEIVSRDIAKIILGEIGADERDIEIILTAIANHRTCMAVDNSLNYIEYYADKLSRNCFLCKAKDTCMWDKSKMNMTIKH